MANRAAGSALGGLDDDCVLAVLRRLHPLDVAAFRSVSSDARRVAKRAVVATLDLTLRGGPDAVERARLREMLGRIRNGSLARFERIVLPFEARYAEAEAMAASLGADAALDGCVGSARELFERVSELGRLGLRVVGVRAVVRAAEADGGAAAGAAAAAAAPFCGAIASVALELPGTDARLVAAVARAFRDSARRLALYLGRAERGAGSRADLAPLAPMRRLDALWVAHGAGQPLRGDGPVVANIAGLLDPHGGVRSTLRSLCVARAAPTAEDLAALAGAPALRDLCLGVHRIEETWAPYEAPLSLLAASESIRYLELAFALHLPVREKLIAELAAASGRATSLRVVAGDLGPARLGRLVRGLPRALEYVATVCEEEGNPLAGIEEGDNDGLWCDVVVQTFDNPTRTKVRREMLGSVLERRAAGARVRFLGEGGHDVPDPRIFGMAGAECVQTHSLHDAAFPLQCVALGSMLWADRYRFQRGPERSVADCFPDPEAPFRSAIGREHYDPYLERRKGSR